MVRFEADGDLSKPLSTPTGSRTLYAKTEKPIENWKIDPDQELASVIVDATLGRAAQNPLKGGCFKHCL